MLDSTYPLPVLFFPTSSLSRCLALPALPRVRAYRRRLSAGSASSRRPRLCCIHGRPWFATSLHSCKICLRPCSAAGSASHLRLPPAAKRRVHLLPASDRGSLPPRLPASAPDPPPPLLYRWGRVTVGCHDRTIGLLDKQQ
ncbi:hypothetical protein PR202_ga22162 [Eleusine coracana subsp. coracana]|uniref:Uncharacterized protein n=1 Tax=Eleusine coracana subsp. coracana TaxID=191504 RepID=A0AAV5D1V3_ELECO|nr:hypothetical protein PR202_ga22162 [Eleusine coracana subsp. coracana]